jgi:hypothetical protein
MPKFERKWTVVQHSGAWKDNTFEFGLESRLITNAAEGRIVARAGGVLFDDYAAAEAYAEAEMYPEGVAGMVPAARGTFAAERIDGLKVYVPPIMYRLTLTDHDGTVLDSTEVTRAELRHAQRSALSALDLLSGLSAGSIPGEAR